MNNYETLEEIKWVDTHCHLQLIGSAINEQDINTNSPNDDLKEKWELILSKLELPSTKMLLSQQAKLANIDSHEVLIALSPKVLDLITFIWQYSDLENLPLNLKLLFCDNLHSKIYFLPDDML